MTDTITTPKTDNQIGPKTCSDQPLESQTRIEIYTDGSAIGNPGHGGCAAVILRIDATGKIVKRLEVSSNSRTALTTNVRMEMTAACLALESLGRVTDEPITVRCDANLIPNGMNGWLSNWKAKGWKTSAGKETVNRDLWERLEGAAKGRNVAFEWLRGHSGHEHNERADKLAYAAARKAEALAKRLSR